jgi:multiple sugar transport system permease protein/sn-glycerol 3-phosphate transport system permease protein
MPTSTTAADAVGVVASPRRRSVQRRSAVATRGRAVNRPLVLPYAFIAPAVLLTAVFSLLPLAMLAYRSFFGGGVFATSLSYVGVGNYTSAFSQGGAHALEVTAIYTVGFIVLTMSLGLGVALLLDVKLPGMDRLRAPFIIPLVVPGVATALIWGDLFAPQFGFVNRMLMAVGLHQANFTASPSLALLTILSFGTWQFFGENVILYLAALKALPVDVIEASCVDGAGPWRRFLYVRWPLLRRNTILIWVITTLTGLQTFTQIYVLTNGGPNGATTTALYYVYNEGFVQFNTGQADAMGMILFLISLLVTVAQVGLIGRGARRDD